MPETKEEEEKRLLRELEGKNIAHYQVLLSAWIQTRMEKDKSITTLSAAAIGLLFTILTTVGIHDIVQLVFFACAFFGFVVAIGLSITIYGANSNHLKNALRGSSKKNLKLEKLDKGLNISFIFGVSCAVIVSCLIALANLEGN